jgi:hypothetical protein
MAYKLGKEVSTKKAFYQNIAVINDTIKEENVVANDVSSEAAIVVPNETDKDYISVVKKVKKDNITLDNIDEIMLCQIPGISSVTAIAIMEKYKNLSNLIKELENDNECLKNISSTNTKGQVRKINKTSIANIVKFLLKK